MPRNGSGTHSIPNTYSDGQTITAAVVNANFADVSSELTNSLAKDGQTTMTGQFKSASGTVSAPGLVFASDLTSGWYRIGADNWGFSVSGTKLLDLSSAVFGVTGALTVSNGFTVSAGSLSLPTGSIETADLADNIVTTAKVTDANITYAKVQNVSATDRLLGRYSSGAGVIEEISLSSDLEIDAGTLGLTTQPASVLISTTTVSGAAALTITAGIDSTYDEYELHIDGLVPATDNVGLMLQVSTNGGSSYEATSYSGVALNLNSASPLTGVTTNIPLADFGAGVSNSSSYGYCGLVRFWPNGSSRRKPFFFSGSYGLSSAVGGPGSCGVSGNGFWDGGNTAINAVRILATSGNISGTVRLIGVRTS